MSRAQRLLCEERGSGTVLAVGIISALMVLIAVIHVVTAAAVAGAQAARAADLAALAAADIARGLSTGDPCTVAEQVTSRNNAALQDCTVGGDQGNEVTVLVSREIDVVIIPEGLNVPPLEAQARARAGPPEAPDP